MLNVIKISSRTLTNTIFKIIDNVSNNNLKKSPQKAYQLGLKWKTNEK